MSKQKKSNVVKPDGQLSRENLVIESNNQKQGALNVSNSFARPESKKGNSDDKQE